MKTETAISSDNNIEIKMDALREKYRTAILKLATLIDDLSPEGERAFQAQDKVCRFLHDQLFDKEVEEPCLTN